MYTVWGMNMIMNNVPLKIFATKAPPRRSTKVVMFNAFPSSIKDTLLFANDHVHLDLCVPQVAIGLEHIHQSRVDPI
jgi:hypothetical protein